MYCLPYHRFRDICLKHRNNVIRSHPKPYERHKGQISQRNFAQKPAQ